MRRLKLSLSLKLIVCLIGSMVLIFSVLGYQNVRLHRRHLEDTVIVSADRISDTIKRSTRYSMMKNHRDEVYHIITTIGAEPGINKIRIFNEEGKISFSTDEHEVNTFVDKKAEACYACHVQEQPLARLNRPDRVRVYAGTNGERILGLINPIENEPSCYNAACHAHAPTKQVLGVLDVTLSLAKVDETIAQGQRRMIANFIGAISIISLIVGGLIWIMVYRPVKQLITGTKRVAAGDLDYKINISSCDEIGELAASFNRMTDELTQANDQLTDWAKTLESRVEQKTAELKRAHEQMIQVERMASIGKLAAIVAHEINNPLAGILTYAKLLLKKARNNGFASGEIEEIKQYLEMISTESARCGDIVKNLLQFARQTAVNLQPNDVNEIVRQSVRLVQHKVDLMSVRTQIELDEHIPTIVCDAQQIKQALVALLINACEAMTSGEGVLEVASGYSPESRAVEIVVRDNGIGMDEETQKHIFEPFFTTKEQGKGVGLGLAVVYGIVNRHAGAIEFESALGQGTTFTIRLPEKPELETGN
ncbi:MAG: HAMP domain-containing protein [Acidobacteria bacterium]|nr:HAMP domain-containing protein [Acidobacteriota bacterium]